MNKKIYTGAEILAQLIAVNGIQYSFGYPGTSELTLCKELSKTTKYRNARGDKEAAFMAGGASMQTPLNSVAVLHGARGLGNALGAVADIKRNELASLILVGLPSRISAKFLPPHGEENLIGGSSIFAKYVFDFSLYLESQLTSQVLIDETKKALEIATQVPYGPVILGIPQDILDNKWEIEEKQINTIKKCKDSKPEYLQKILQSVSDVLNSSENIVILVDDYYLKYPESEKYLGLFSEALDAPVLQIRYRRGPMLFQRINIDNSRCFIGWYDPNDKQHHSLLEEADLIITLEDRNMYSRVTGALPDCKKLIINSDLNKALKNNYYKKEYDLCIEKNPVAVLKDLLPHINTKGKKFDKSGFLNKENIWIENAYSNKMRSSIVTIINDILSLQKEKIIVDDSQMFGGLISNVYDKLINNVRIYGDHGAFVGGGMAYALGISTTKKEDFIVCFVGDQAFINGLQSLTYCSEYKSSILFVLCNNGKSVSLSKQLMDEVAVKEIALYNPPSFSATSICKAFGLKTFTYDFLKDNLEETRLELDEFLNNIIRDYSPGLLELKLPSEFDYWEGVWNNFGYENISFK